MSNFLYVDNSNVWIEGMHVAAVKNGLAADIADAQERHITDASWKLDFGRLYEFAGGETSEVGRAVLYGSKPPPNDTLWVAAKKKGFEVIIHERNAYSNKEKKVDTNIAADIVEDACVLMKPNQDEVTLVAGDSDYVPIASKLEKRGIKFFVVFWEHASGELRRIASKFISLNPHLDYLKFKARGQ